MQLPDLHEIALKFGFCQHMDFFFQASTFLYIATLDYTVLLDYAWTPGHGLNMPIDLKLQS